MTVVLNPVHGDGSIANSLRELGESMFGDQAKKELIRQEARGSGYKADRLLQENQNIEPFAADLRDNNQKQALYHGTLSNNLPHLPATLLAASGVHANGNVESPQLATASMGAGHPYSGTVPGAREAQAERERIARLQTDPMGLFTPTGTGPQPAPKPMVEPRPPDIPMVDNTGVPREPQAGEYPPVSEALANAKPQLQALGQQRLAEAGGPAALTTTGQATPPATTPAQPVDRTAQIDQVLSKYPSAIAAQARAVIRGDAAFPTVASTRRNPYAQAIRDAVYEAEPGTNEYTFAARQVMQKAWANGQAGNNVKSFNMVLPHLHSYVQTMAQLGNGDTPAINAIRNFIAVNQGKPEVGNAMTAALAAGTEIPKLLRGVGALNEAEERHWQARLSPNQSPPQVAGAARELAELLEARMGSEVHSYKSIMGGREPPVPLSPQAQQALTAIKGAQPARLTVNPARQRATNAEGHIIEFDGQQWVPVH